MKKLLVDADILRYSYGSVQMKHPYIEGAFIPAPPEQVCKLVDNLIERSCEACKTTDYICALSGKGNFRHDIAKQVPYKGNRNPNMSRPYHYDTLTDHIIKNHPHVVVDTREPDDWIGATQYADWKYLSSQPDFNIDQLNTIIATTDKDLRTLPGWHYSWCCGKKQPERPMYYITPAEGMYQFFYQMLIGDNTDNIMGCGKKELVPWGKEVNEEGEEVPSMMVRRKGVGETGAKKILNSCKTVADMKDRIFEAYKDRFKEEYEEIMLENARLLFIGQSEDNLFEWRWIDDYLELENDKYVDTTTRPKRTRKKKGDKND